jgi:hypothetical protein
MKSEVMRVKLSVLCALGLFLLSCGIKGDPLPPLTPPELGRGQPSFKKASEEINFPDDVELQEDEEGEEDEIEDPEDEEE